jgi:hypothetical protein
MFSPGFDPGPVDRGHHRICTGLQIQIFWEIKFGLYAPGGWAPRSGDGRDLSFRLRRQGGFAPCRL